MTFRELEKMLASKGGIITIQMVLITYIDIMKKLGSIPVPSHKGDIPKGLLTTF